MSNVNLSKSVSMNLKKHLGVEGGKGSKAHALDTIDAADEAPSVSSTPAPKSAGQRKTAV